MDPSAARIARTLMYHGHSNVKILDVGLNEWQKSGLPVTRHISTQKQTSESVHFKSKINSMIRADADVIKAKQLQNHSSTVVIDARTSREHMQARIPGSILDSWEEGLGHNGKMMKSKEELERDFEKKRISKDKEYFDCHSIYFKLIWFIIPALSWKRCCSSIRQFFQQVIGKIFLKCCLIMSQVFLFVRNGFNFI